MSVAVVIGIAAAAFLVGRNLVDLATDASESPGVVSNEFVVELDDVRFAFPYEPVTESAPFEVEGTHAVASTWYIENDDLFLDAIHIEFAGAAMATLEQDPATQIGPVFGGTLVDVVIGGFARQVGGSIARSEAIDVEGAIVSQRGEIDTDDGTIFIEVYYLGTTLLAVMGSDYTDSTPETYLDLVASVELQS